MRRLRHIGLGFALLAAATPVLGASPQSTEREPLPCEHTVVSGRVEKGAAFAEAFANDLVFRLDPETHPANPPGWTIRVTPASDRAMDLAQVATPPFRFSNPRYLDLSYGISAERALEWSPRAFRYVASPADYRTAMDCLGVLLWPGASTEAEIAAAQSSFDSLATYEGRLWIEAGDTTSPESGAEPAIAWVEFRVELCLPSSPEGKAGIEAPYGTKGSGSSSSSSPDSRSLPPRPIRPSGWLR